MSASEYTDLASEILAFYPPEILMPLSPMTVSAPLLKDSTSLISYEASRARVNYFWSNSRPMRMFSLMLPEIMNGSYST